MHVRYKSKLKIYLRRNYILLHYSYKSYKSNIAALFIDFIIHRILFFMIISDFLRKEI